uniref:Putative secreted protein n=1 Tax=Rhipicephalus microplus TaxID=6941 RepID=A0A6M2D982_RHIMP
MTKVFLLLLLAAIGIYNLSNTSGTRVRGPVVHGYSQHVSGRKGFTIVVQARKTVNGAADLEYDSYSNEEEQFRQKDNNTNHEVAKPRIPTNSSEGDLEQLPSDLSGTEDLQAENMLLKPSSMNTSMS